MLPKLTRLMLEKYGQVISCHDYRKAVCNTSILKTYNSMLLTCFVNLLKS